MSLVNVFATPVESVTYTDLFELQTQLQINHAKFSLALSDAHERLEAFAATISTLPRPRPQTPMKRNKSRKQKIKERQMRRGAK